MSLRIRNRRLSSSLSSARSPGGNAGTATAAAASSGAPVSLVSASPAEATGPGDPPRHSSMPAFTQASAPIMSKRSTSSSATRSHIRGSRGGSAASWFISASASSVRSIMNSARASGARGSTKEGPPSSSARMNPLAAAAGSSASSHCSPARV